MKSINNYENLYSVDKDGNVYSSYLNRNLSQWLANGYCRIRLSKNGQVKNYFVHRLVAETFLGNPENKPDVNHKDGVKTNNKLVNLEWVTKSENSLHAVRLGLMKCQGEDNILSKLTEVDVFEILDLCENRYLSYKLIGEMYGVTRHTISKIDKGQTWKHIRKQKAEKRALVDL